MTKEEEYSDIEIALWKSHENNLRCALLEAGLTKAAAGILVAVASMQGPVTWEALKDTFEHKEYLDYIPLFERSSAALTSKEIKLLKNELATLRNAGAILKTRRGYQLARLDKVISGLRDLSPEISNNSEERIRKPLSYMEMVLLDRGWVVNGKVLRQIGRVVIDRKHSRKRGRRLAPLQLPIEGWQHIVNQEELREETIDVLQKAGTKSRPGKIHVVTEYGTWLTKEPNQPIIKQKAEEGVNITAILVDRPQDPAGKAWDTNVSALTKIPKCEIFCVTPREHNHHMTLIDDYYAIYFYRQGLSLTLIPFYTNAENHPKDIAWLKKRFDNLLRKAKRLS